MNQANRLVAVTKAALSESLTQTRLRSVLDYSPDTGEFIWLMRDISAFATKRAFSMWNARYAGKSAGSATTKGYTRICITINGKQGRYQAHRLAFLWMEGEFPKHQADHINGLRSDNRWANLRRVTNRGNQKNTKMRSDNTSGVVGVYWHKKTGRWSAQIGIPRQYKYLGRYRDWFEAVCVRKSAELKHGYHINHGRSA